MKHFTRTLCTVLAAVMLLSTMLAGCSAPKLMIGGTPDVAGTVGDREIPTGEYLAYLYNTFYDMFYNQGLYQYLSYGYDVWGQEYTYGTGDAAKKVNLSEYITLSAQDTMVRQEALIRLMKKYNLSWIKDEEKKANEAIKDMRKDAYLTFGISDENYLKAYRNLALNERSLFFGLYGKGGEREVKEADLRKYFTENYLSFKIISMPLTDSNGKELDAAGKKKITDKLNGYLEKYNKDKNFEAIVDANRKENAGKDEKIEPSKDKDNRVNEDAKNLDEALAKAIRTVDVGKAKVVEYKANGSTPTAALVLRLDINTPKELFTDSTENILNALKYEEFDKEVKEAAKAVNAEFKKSVVKKCKPENFLPEK